MKIGIIGSGHIGGTLTRRLRELGHDVTVANSRGPGSLAGLAAETGAIAGTAAEAAHAELVILAVPLRAVPALPAADLAGRVVIDADNYYPSRDGQIAEIDGGSTSSRWTAGLLPGAQLVKVFNNIQSDHLLGMGRPPGSAGRIALPVAADDATAKRLVMGLVDELGFDPIDAGGLDDSWRQEPGTPVYGTDGDADEVRAGLAAATR
ncbi:NADPH-dependent F420 reductase [Dactylosporangium darangshiense]|uniref:NAD(P)-binding domain-containing protein n=1 Tax=Dactylosporangium darangshiense TaxID=579108 RepID=A0ABP8D054_9ACTN